MRSNLRLQCILAIRQLGGRAPAAASAVDQSAPSLGDLRLFTLTFAGGFLFTSIFLG